MTEYKYDILNDMTDAELIEALKDRLSDYRRECASNVSLEHMLSTYHKIVDMVEKNLEAGVEPRHIIRHIKTMKGELQ